MFYDKFVQICKSRGISPSRAAIEAGLSKSTVTKWKTTPDAEPTGAALKKITEYFGITIAELLGEETEKAPTSSGERAVSDAKAAFFEGYGDNLSEEEKDALWEDARVYAKFKAQQKK